MEPDQIRINTWHAMSDLYMDNELDVGDYLHVGVRLAETSYSLEELERIFFDEVHPALCWNLTLVAGEWGTADPEWVQDLVLKGLTVGPSEGWFRRRAQSQKLKQAEKLKALVNCDWEKVKLVVEIVRGRGLSKIPSP